MCIERLSPVMKCADMWLCPTVKLHTRSSWTERTPSMHSMSFVIWSTLILVGTASKMMPMDSFMIVQVVMITMMEKTNVQRGSAIFAFGCQRVNRC